MLVLGASDCKAAVTVIHSSLSDAYFLLRAVTAILEKQ